MSRIPVEAIHTENQLDNLPGFITSARQAALGHSRSWLPVFAALLLAAAGTQAQAIFNSTAVGSATQASVTVTAPNGGTVYSVEILTAGAPNMDFTQGSGSSCVSATPLAAGGACTQSVLFTPSAPGLRIGAVVLLDGSGNVLGTEYLAGTGLGGLAVQVPGNVIPIAGILGDYEGPVDNGGPATQGVLNHPSGVAMDGAGNLYIADRYHHMIRMVCASASSATIRGTGVNCTGANIIVTIVGNGNPNYTGDNGPAALATLDTPWGVALDGAGNLYIADAQNNAVREVSAATGIITTVAGNGPGCPGQSDTVGDGCPAVSAELNTPQGVTIDSGGNLYIADTYNHRIREVNPVTGIIGTVAGSGFMNADGSGAYAGDNGQAGKADLNFPFAVAFDAQGNMYIPDSMNNVVREVTAAGGVISGSSIITTFAGTGAPADAGNGGPAASADLFAPSGVAVDAAGNVYIADTQNDSIRKVSSAASATPGIITSIAANGAGQYYYNGHFITMDIYAPLGLFLDGSGNLYFADSLNMLVREIQSNYAVLDFLGTPVREGFTSGAKNQTVENDGNAPLDVTAITHDANAEIYDAGTTCATGTPYMAEDADCNIAALFAPSIANPTLEGNIYVASDTQPGLAATNPLLDIELIGDGTLDNTTTTTVTSTPNPSDFGQTVVFTVTVTTGSNSGNLTGTVSIFDGTTTLVQNLGLNPPAGTTVTATFSTGLLAVGLHSITATYNTSNDSKHYTSTSDAYIQTVNEVTATNLTSSANPSALGAGVTFTATVTAAGNGGGVTPDGAVTFSNGATILSTVPLPANGVATYTTSAIPQGLSAITATYSGDSSVEILGSTSNTVEQDVQASSYPVVTSSLNPSTYGASVTFTITVTSGGAIAPTGVVNILDGGTRIGQVTLVGATGQTTFTTTALTVATHQITASYQGDTNNAASTSAPYSQVVNKATPTLTWATPAAIPYGTALSGTQLDATSGGVDGTFVYTPASGTVLAVGTYTLSVTFTPTLTADYTTATATVQLTVNVATPTIAVTSSLPTSTYGAAVTFTAMVSNGPTGIVTFYSDGNAIGTGTLAGNVARLTIATLAVGTHQITASITATGNYNSATSSPIQQVVNMATPVITWATPAAITYGTALNATQLDATASVGGTFTYTPASGTVLGAGAQKLNVLFTPADSTDYSTATGSVTLTVNKAVPVITWATPAAITYGTPLGAAQLDATASVGGTFTYTPAAGAIVPAGVQTLSATFMPSDASDYTSPTDTVQLTVSKATPTLVVTTSGSPSYYGATVTLTATISASATGVVTFYNGANAIGTGTLAGTVATLNIATLPVGTNIITASWPGNGNYNSVTSGPITQTVTITQTSTTVTAVPNPAIAGVPLAITATVKVIGGSATPTGSVTFTSGGVTLGSAALNNAGTAAISPALAPGVYPIVAIYSGDANDNTSVSSPYSLTVSFATTSTSITSTPNPSVAQSTVTYTAKVTGNGGVPTGSVTFYADGDAMEPAVNLDSTGTAVFTYARLAAGSHQITAVYSGDVNNSTSTSAPITQVVQTIPTVTYLGFASTSGATPQVILVASVLNASGLATPAPTGTVTFESGTTVIGSGPVDSNFVATLTLSLPDGSYTITAYYSGDLLHGPSTSAPVTVAIPGTGFNLSVTPAAVTIPTSQNATVTVTLASIDGFADSIGLGCASLPPGVTCHFSTISASLTASQSPSPTVQLTIDTNYPLTGGSSSAMNSRSAPPGAYLAGLALPFSLFFGWVFWRFRRRHATFLTTVLIILLSGAALLASGCGGMGASNAIPGTYVIQVTGTGANSGIIHYQNVTLNITAQ